MVGRWMDCDRTVAGRCWWRWLDPSVPVPVTTTVPVTATVPVPVLVTAVVAGNDAKLHPCSFPHLWTIMWITGGKDARK